ncbi:Thaumatin [Trema orientale]|uniref:Thaumatin n=1 Tax=Trema orientale TaxID=63057 RepID=A0A2P5A823_TREOI|nr:Thaumatin [Trema orientale]
MTVILSFVYLTILSFSMSGQAANLSSIEILNNCSYTIWAAANPGGGKQLNKGQTWTLTSVTGSGRIWGRTNCAFDDHGLGKCDSGDCGGLLECDRRNGRAPHTVAEYSMDQVESGKDAFFVSVVDGFNIPMEFTLLSSSSGVCGQSTSRCAADVNGPCPMELRDAGGCNNPCTVFRNSQFCCNTGIICEPTSYSKFFKDLCPEARTYPSDGIRGYCTNGRNSYKVVFCPSTASSTILPTPSNTGINIAIMNNCPYTVWAAAIPGGGRRLDSGQSWVLGVPKKDNSNGRIWGRTNCTFDKDGRGSGCETGDCNGLLECQGGGRPPKTMAEYTLNQFGSPDFFDISLVDGFNVPMEFSPTSEGCSRGVKCGNSTSGSADTIKEQCPHELRAPGGCNGPCTVFKTGEHCCTGSYANNCGATSFSKFFKDRCPGAISYPLDEENTTFRCPSGTNYEAVFCP